MEGFWDELRSGDASSDKCLFEGRELMDIEKFFANLIEQFPVGSNSMSKVEEMLDQLLG